MRAQISPAAARCTSLPSDTSYVRLPVLGNPPRGSVHTHATPLRHSPPQSPACMQVSQFLQSPANEARAVSAVAKLLRRTCRQDLLHIKPASDDGTLQAATFPDSVVTRAGLHLHSFLPYLPDMTTAAAAAVAQHLTLCEALLLPAPFPAQGLSHFLTASGGVLDLCPPRVPAFTPDDLRALCRQISPLIATSPPISAVRIPAPCLPPSGQLIPAIASVLGKVTELSITHGKVSYTDMSQPHYLDPKTVAAVLRCLSPVALRKLAVDAILDVTADPIHGLLSSFTGLTYLRVSNVPPALRHGQIPALTSLVLTHLSAGRAQRKIVSEAKQRALCRIHGSGTEEATRFVYEGFTGQDPLVQLPPDSGVLDMSAADLGDQGDGAGNTVFCCAHPMPSCSASLQSHVKRRSGIVSSAVTFFRYSRIRRAWGLPPPEDPQAQPQLQDGDSQALRELAGVQELCVAMRGGSTEVDDIARRVLLGDVSHQLRVLCVLCMRDLPPRSCLALGRCAPKPPKARVRNPRDAEEKARQQRQRELYNHGCGWVTARPSGVAHPLCALEMLHYNSFTEPSGTDPGAGSLGVLLHAASTPTLHTLRLSEVSFRTFQV